MKNNIKQWFWINYQRINLLLHSQQSKKNTAKLGLGLGVVFLGLFFTGLVLLGNFINPFLFYVTLIKYAFHPLMYDSTITMIAVYLIAGCAIGSGFKMRFFNFGVVGQMLLSGSLILLLGISQTKYQAKTHLPIGHHMAPSIFLLLAFLIAITASIFSLGVATFLKTKLNISEVITTIMLNYALFFVAKWIFLDHNFLFDKKTNGSRIMTNDYHLLIHGHYFVLPLVVALLISVGLFVLFRYTTFGYQVKSVGQNPEAAYFSGFPLPRNIILMTILSGFLIGVVSFFYYLTIARQISFSSDLLPVFGFNAIAISLVAFHHPLAMILVSGFWGIISQGTTVAAYLPELHVSPYVTSLILGTILYFSSMLVVLFQLGIRHGILRRIIYYCSPVYRQKNKIINQKIKSLKKSLHTKQRAFKTLTLKEQKAQLILNTKQLDINDDLIIRDAMRSYRQKMKDNQLQAYLNSYFYQKNHQKQAYYARLFKLMLNFQHQWFRLRQQQETLVNIQVARQKLISQLQIAFLREKHYFLLDIKKIVC